MSLLRQTIDIPDRFKKYIAKFKDLFKEYGVTSVSDLVKQVRNPEFREKWLKIWGKIANNEGGKLSLTTIGIMIGSSIGGVGIATMGGAIGLPLAFVLGLGGYLAGSEIDENKFFNNVMNLFKRKSKSKEKSELSEFYIAIKGIEEILGQYSAHLIDLENNIERTNEQILQIAQEIDKIKRKQKKLVMVVIISIILSMIAVLSLIFS